MIPVRLQVSGFLSYQNTVTLDFQSFELACISGQNGAGKSSLLDAITWALFGQARRKDDALINSHTQVSSNSDNECRVIFDFEYEGMTYRINRCKQRDKAATLEFQVLDSDRNWKPLTEHSIRETENRIEQTLRMDYETFTNASFFLQGKADQFAQQKPSERKRILSSILGLEIWEGYRDQANLRRKKLDDELSSLNAILDEIDKELQEEETRKNKLIQLQAALDTQSTLRKSQEKAVNHLRLLSASLKENKKMVDLLEQQTRSAKEKFIQTKTELDKRTLELDGCQTSLKEADQIESDYQRWLLDKEKLEQWERVAADFRQHENQRSAPVLIIETEKARLEQELNSLLTKADQVDELQTHLLRMDEEILQNQKLVSGSSSSLEKAMRARDDLNLILDQQAEAVAENKRLRQEMNELKERIDHLQQSHGAACPLCGQTLEQEERQTLIESLESAGRQKGDQYRANQTLAGEINQKREEIEKITHTIPSLEMELRSNQRNMDQVLDRKTQAESILAGWLTHEKMRLEALKSQLSNHLYAVEAWRELEIIDDELRALGYDPTKHENARQTELAGRSSLEAFQKLESARAGLIPLEREKERLETQTKVDESAWVGMDQQFQKASDKYRTDESQIPDISQAETELLNCLEQENRIRMEVGAANQQVEVLKTIFKRKEGINLQRATLQRQIGQIKILERAFGKDGIPALLIEQALPEIESQANDILDRLSDGGMSVSFSTQKDYKDKNREDKKETLDILISDSAGKREYEMFSGGEAFRVNFAIRLALSRVLAQRAGARLQTLVIDEGFGSQDAEGRQRLIQAINLVQPDFAKILVITHLEELKDAFPARIEVEKDSKGSSIKVIV